MFYDAIRLELEEYLDVLNFEFAHPINPLRIDAIIIKKDRNIDIKKNIAKVFKAVNSIEYVQHEVAKVS
ncbi:hypothetical protein FACS1894200_13820 [Spirochaetia bacterium]|nr:hypothetical protein FACS1894200_13820 [Spirochaetia bacterium]